MRDERSIRFTIRLSETERSWLYELAKAKGLTPSDWLRQALRREKRFRDKQIHVDERAEQLAQVAT